MPIFVALSSPVISLSNLGTSFQISWGAVSGASGYNIYRSTVPNSGFTQIGSTSSLSYTDSTAFPSIVYYYTVTSVGSSGVSTVSNEGSGILLDPIVVSPPSTGTVIVVGGTEPDPGPTGTASVPPPTGTQQVIGSDGYYLQALQKGANLNIFFRENNRFQGQREAIKYHVPIQATLMICCSNFLSLRASEKKLLTDETTLVYPTNDEISSLYHIQAQTKFRSWLLLKDVDVSWFI